MKRTIVASILGIAASVATVASSYGQGHIWFDNYNSPAGKVTYGDSGYGSPGPVGTGVDSSYQAALYYGLGTVSEPADPDGTAIPQNLQLLTASGQPAGYPAMFAINGAPPGYFKGPILTIPDYINGPITFEIVVWKGGTYYGDPLNGPRGHSAAFTMASITTGSLAANIFDSGLTDFQVFLIPEPSTFALAGLGAAALLIFRLRK
ncbi:MAG: PEP-CTERM sorting domain-containing protein [Verrucomicrobia bacterium]|nr:PEP-CTERM sorting domain-containing protein [Verrucomicrobiota bacterium]